MGKRFKGGIFLRGWGEHYAAQADLKFINILLSARVQANATCSPEIFFSASLSILFLCLSVFLVCAFFVVLRIELGTLCMPGKHFTNKLQPGP